MSDGTIDRLHPYQSTRDLDGIYTDREVVQDIAYDGEPSCAARIAPTKVSICSKRSTPPGSSFSARCARKRT